MKNSLKTAEPNSELLRSCIAFYYFDESNEESAKKSYIYYPHFNNGLSIYRDSRIILKHPYATETIPEPDYYGFGYSKLITNAAHAELHAPFSRIVVVFQPLGLNHFLKGYLSEYVQHPIHVDFEVFQVSMRPILDSIFDASTIQEKVSLLDSYFLSEYKGFNDEKMVEAMKLLFVDDAKYSVELLAEELEVSRKTLLRMFRKHQNCSVIDYIKLLQFRKSIVLFQKTNDKTKLTDLALGTDYYDQSDFINHFKKITGFNPKSFFKNLSIVSEQGTFWTLR